VPISELFAASLRSQGCVLRSSIYMPSWRASKNCLKVLKRWLAYDGFIGSKDSQILSRYCRIIKFNFAIKLAVSCDGIDMEKLWWQWQIWAVDVWVRPMKAGWGICGGVIQSAPGPRGVGAHPICFFVGRESRSLSDLWSWYQILGTAYAILTSIWRYLADYPHCLQNWVVFRLENPTDAEN
jgi:hypothetical protein